MIEIIISTIGNNIFRIPESLLAPRPDVAYLIIHQDPQDTIQLDCLPAEFQRLDVRYLRYVEKGLPISRNRGAENFTGDFLIFTDDDVRFFSQGLNELRAEFERFPDADLITFKAQLPAGGYYKKYWQRSFTHTFRTLLQVSSIEFAIRSSSLEKYKLRWDENFGLGAKYGGGLEVVFLHECRKKGAKIVFSPITIVSHPQENLPGRKLDAPNAVIRGAVFGRIFGRMAIFYCAWFTIKKRMSCDLRIGMFDYLRAMIVGLNDWRRSL